MAASPAASRPAASDADRLRTGASGLLWILSFVWFSLFCGRYGVMLLDNGDTPWHLAAGDLIRSLGQVPPRDPWSFTAGDAPWRNHSWLYDVWLSLLAQAAGLAGLVIAHALMGTALMAFLARECLRRGAGIIATFLIFIPVTLMVLPVIQVRPQLVSMLLACYAYRLCTLHREGRAWALWALPPLLGVWVHLHGGFLVGFLLIGLFGLEALLHRAWRNFWQLALAGAGSAAIILLTPLGIDMVFGAFDAMNTAYSQIIAEWAPPLLWKDPGFLAWLLLAFTVFHASDAHHSLVDRMLVPLWLVLGIASVRHVSFCAVLTAPALAVALHECLARSPLATRYGHKNDDYARDMARPAVRRIAALLSVTALATVSLPQSRAYLWHKPLMDPARFPIEEISWLAEQRPGARVFNHYDYGGLMIYLARDRLHPFIDGRAGTAYPAQIAGDFKRIWLGEEGGRTILLGWKADAVLMPIGWSHAHSLRDHGWRTVHHGPVAMVMEREGQ